jgi:hypothetical protein
MSVILLGYVDDHDEDPRQDHAGQQTDEKPVAAGHDTFPTVVNLEPRRLSAYRLEHGEVCENARLLGHHHNSRFRDHHSSAKQRLLDLSSLPRLAAAAEHELQTTDPQEANAADLTIAHNSTSD